MSAHTQTRKRENKMANHSWQPICGKNWRLNGKVYNMHIHTKAYTKTRKRENKVADHVWQTKCVNKVLGENGELQPITF